MQICQEGRALTLHETGLTTQVRHEKLTNHAKWTLARVVVTSRTGVRSENDEKREERRGDLSDGRAIGAVTKS